MAITLVRVVFSHACTLQVVAIQWLDAPAQERTMAARVEDVNHTAELCPHTNKCLTSLRAHSQTAELL